MSSLILLALLPLVLGSLRIVLTLTGWIIWLLCVATLLTLAFILFDQGHAVWWKPY